MKRSLPHDAYDAIADSYAVMIDTKPHNAYYERPATQSLVGEIAGQQVLDAGCGSGVYTQWLLERGAKVVAVDANEKMLAHAKRRNGDNARFYAANLEEPLAFLEGGSFDGVLSALTVTYIRDLDRLFAEFARILRKNGWLVFSTEHPFFSYQHFELEDYFDHQLLVCDWHGFGTKVSMPGYYRSLSDIVDALANSGFVVERILEPRPTEQFRVVDPQRYERLMRFPLFVCLRARLA